MEKAHKILEQKAVRITPMRQLMKQERWNMRYVMNIVLRFII